jgi:uncharacterized protein YbbC (DUF1343 family)
MRPPTYRCVLLLILLLPARAQAQVAWWPDCKPRALPGGTAGELSADLTLKGDLDALLQWAVDSGRVPAAALVVLRNGRVLYRGGAGGAGPRSIFDVASLTKVAATAPAVLAELERGKHPAGLGSRPAAVLPWLRAPGKRAITLEQLLMHTSGLPSVVWAGKPEHGRARILPRIRRAKLQFSPGTGYQYSDTGYIVLGEWLAAAAGQGLDIFVQRRLYHPLGICDSGFNPPARVLPRVLSAWPDGGKKGQVYDPLAARLGGVAGHAGLFSTADDLARLGQMLLEGGALQGTRVLSKGSVDRMLRPRALPGQGGRRRALGWDVSSPHAASRGRLSARAVGHTGFTGTSLWLDPGQRLVLALLTNRTRREPARAVGPLRRQVHDLVAGALQKPSGVDLQHPSGARVQTGLDRLVATDFKALRGRRVGLITNRAAVDRRGRWVGDLLLSAPSGVDLRALFVPEHGLGADREVHIRDGELRRGKRRIPIHSLFGPRRRPSPGALEGLDTLVFDVPTVGVRYYTYLSTMGWAMEQAARHGLRFVVLDRPNPLGGLALQGPVSSPDRRTSTNYHPIPVRHGMTVGELARLYNAQRRIGVKLEVIRVQGWRREQMFDRQGLPWRNPSPNIRSWRQALLYAGVGLLETTNLAVGRGTDSPFQLLGAPWIDGRRLAVELNRLKLTGVTFAPARFTPTTGKHRDRACQGVRLLLTDPRRLDAPAMGAALALTLRRLYPRDWKTDNLYRLINNPATTRRLLAGSELSRVVAGWQAGLRRFRHLRQRYLLY